MSLVHAHPAVFRPLRILLPLFLFWCAGLVTGCGGGDSPRAAVDMDAGGTPPAEGPAVVEPSVVMTGVAAVGRALEGYVYIQDAAGTTINVPIGAGGRYAADITFMEPPFILQARANDGSVWYSYAPAAIPANVSQLTTLALYLANGKTDLDALFMDWAQQHEVLTELAVLRAQLIVNLNLSELFDAWGLYAGDYNFLTTGFATDGTGFDGVLDSVGPINFSNGAYQISNQEYQASFDETPPPDLDPGEFDLLAASLAYNATYTATLRCDGTLVVTCPLNASCTNWTVCPIRIDSSGVTNEPLPAQHAGGSYWQMANQQGVVSLTDPTSDSLEGANDGAVAPGE